MRGLTTSEAGKHGTDGAQHDQQIEPERNVLDVVDVIFKLTVHAIHFGGIALLHLGPAGDAGTHHVAIMEERYVLLVPVGQVHGFRTWTDQAHFALQHVEQLGQFIHAILANHLAHAGDVWILAILSVATSLLVDEHAAELVDGERPALEAHALLGEEHRPPALQSNSDGGGSHQRQGEGQR